MPLAASFQETPILSALAEPSKSASLVTVAQEFLWATAVQSRSTEFERSTTRPTRPWHTARRTRRHSFRDPLMFAIAFVAHRRQGASAESGRFLVHRPPRALRRDRVASSPRNARHDATIPEESVFMKSLWLPGGLVGLAVGSSVGLLDAACPCQAGRPTQIAMNQIEVDNGLAPIPEVAPPPPVPKPIPPQATSLPPPPPPPLTAPKPIPPQATTLPPTPIPAVPEAAAPEPSSPVISSEPIGTPIPIPGTNRFGMAPPPGTLGKTYQRRTTLLPDEKHPRVGIVNVHVGEDVDVTARGLKSKWNGEYWQLESEAPLIPGIPHIYAIKTERKYPNGQTQVDVRWVRLIMGRVVDLEL
jgi:hypothetical protein